MEEVTQRFSHLSEAIFKFLNTETLIRCQSVSKIWQNYLVDIMNERRVVVLQRNIQNFREIQDFNANFDLESEQKTIQLARTTNVFTILYAFVLFFCNRLILELRQASTV